MQKCKKRSTTPTDHRTIVHKKSLSKNSVEIVRDNYNKSESILI